MADSRWFPASPSSIRRAGRAWSQRAVQAITGDSSDRHALGEHHVEEEVDDRTSRTVIDLAMRVAVATLSAGATAAEVITTVLSLTDAYGLHSVHVDVTYTAIIVSHHRGVEQDPVTMMRAVTWRQTNFSRLSALDEFVQAVVAEPPPVDQARAEFAMIVAEPLPYRRTIVTLALCMMSCLVCVLFGARSWQELGLVAVATALVDTVYRSLSERQVPPFFCQVVGGAVPALLAMGVAAGRAAHLEWALSIQPSRLVAAGIIGLLAGSVAVGAARDALSGYFVTATARVAEVVVATTGIVVGIVGVLTVQSRLVGAGHLAPPAAAGPSIWVQPLVAAGIAACFAVGSFARPRTALLSCFTGAFAWSVYLLSDSYLHHVPAASAAGALAAGWMAGPLSRVARVPVGALTASGIVALLPGVTIYRGLYFCVIGASGEFTSDVGVGLMALGTASATGLGLAAGVSVGSFLGRSSRELIRMGFAGVRQRGIWEKDRDDHTKDSLR